MASSALAVRLTPQGKPVAAGQTGIGTTGKKRDRSFAYRAYLDRLKVGTELEGPTMITRQ